MVAPNRDPTERHVETDPESSGIDRRTLLERGAVVAGTLAVGSGSVAAATRNQADRLEWTFDTGEDIWTKPAVADGTVYFGSKSDRIYALDAETGTEQWSYDTGDDVFSNPVVVDGTLYIGANGKVRALDTASGTENWTYDVPAALVGSPVVADGTVYVGHGAGKLLAMDAASGTVDWEFDAGESVLADPTVDGNTVYSGTREGTLYAIDRASGTESWSFAVSGEVHTPAVGNGTVFVGSGDFDTRDNTLYALDAANGTEQWQYTPGDTFGLIDIVYHDGTVYPSTANSVLHAVDAASGTEEWSFDGGGPMRGAPTIVDDVLYIASGPTVFALDLETGTEQWSYATSSDPRDDVDNGALTVANGTVYVGGDVGTLYAISTDSGTPTLDNYAGADDKVGTGELLQAISDWSDGKIGTALLVQVIQAWATGETV